jgi:DNA-binding transcriptional ArsR family regulator
MYSNIQKNVKGVSEFMKVISHEKRLLILCLLIDWEKNINELQKLLDISQSLVSQFTTKMKNMWYIQSEKRWKEVFYSIADKKVWEVIKALKKIYC